MNNLEEGNDAALHSRTFGEFSDSRKLLKNGAGDGIRTRDVQLGKLHDTLISDI